MCVPTVTLPSPPATAIAPDTFHPRKPVWSSSRLAPPITKSMHEATEKLATEGASERVWARERECLTERLVVRIGRRRARHALA